MAEQAQHDLDEALPALAEAMKVEMIVVMYCDNTVFVR